MSQQTDKQQIENTPIKETASTMQAFAKVQGNPVTVLPHDLYIPSHALEVFLETFEGPLDFLLYLVKRQNLDILNIPMAQITEQYMQYVELMGQLRLVLAAEYLLMASTLAEIKSRMLLPRPQSVREEEDPRAELIRRFQEYERYKKAADDLCALPRLERDNYLLSPVHCNLQTERPLPSVSLQQLLLAFKDISHRVKMRTPHHVARERLSVGERMSDIVNHLRHHEFLKFAALFRTKEGRAGVVVAFMAILELSRKALIDMVQTEPLAPIYLRSAA